MTVVTSNCTIFPCHVNITISFNLTNASFVNIQIVDLDGKMEVFFEGTDLLTGYDSLRHRNPIIQWTSQLSDLGSAELSYYIITLQIGHAQRLRYGIRVEGNVGQRVRHDHTETLVFPSEGKES